MFAHYTLPLYEGALQNDVHPCKVSPDTWYYKLFASLLVE